jgi:hypothetical protein
MAEQPAGRRVALFLIARDRMREVCGGVRHGAELPFSEFLGRRQVDIPESRVANWKSNRPGHGEIGAGCGGNNAANSTEPRLTFQYWNYYAPPLKTSTVALRSLDSVGHGRPQLLAAGSAQASALE